MIKFQSFSSGSAGNSTFVTNDNTSILIDCGATGSYIEKCASRLGKSLSDIFGIFITHSHIDHIAAAGTLSRKYNLPIYATESTLFLGEKHLGNIDEKNLHIINSGEDILAGDLKIRAFPISHDVEGAVSFTVSDSESKFGIATDSGCITDEILENLTGCNTVIVEANHDVSILKNGPYPINLKKRILGDFGHLSNELCGELCVKLAKSGTKEFWIGHLSEQNNVPDLAYSAVCHILSENGINVGRDVALNVIPRHWIED